MDLDLLAATLRVDEGVESKPYKDSRGFLTIGVGHNLDSEGLCQAAISAQLDYDIHSKALTPLDMSLPWWREHPEAVQQVLANLAFNMGIRTLLTFPRMLKLIQVRQYKSAAVELLASKYAQEVPLRAKRLAEALRSVV